MKNSLEPDEKCLSPSCSLPWAGGATKGTACTLFRLSKCSRIQAKIQVLDGRVLDAGYLFLQQNAPCQQCGDPQTTATHSSESQLMHEGGLAQLSVLPLLLLLLSRFSHVQLCVTAWTVARQAPLSMRFSRKECWSGLPFLPLGDHPHPGIKTMSRTSLHWQVGSVPLAPPGKPQFISLCNAKSGSLGVRLDYTGGRRKEVL